MMRPRLCTTGAHLCAGRTQTQERKGGETMSIRHTAAPFLAKCYSFSLEGMAMKTSNPDAGGAFLALIHIIDIPLPASL